MVLTWIDVTDSAIKIGLGAIISAVSGCLVLSKTHAHEVEKELKSHFYKCQEERKIKYIDFLSQSQGLVQAHLHNSCTCQDEDYKRYLRIYSEVQIIAPDQIRISSYELLYAVNQFIVINKTNIEVELIRNLRNDVNNKTGMFQKLAQEDVTKPYSKSK